MLHKIQQFILRRDKNFSAVGTSLSRKAKAISAQYEERHEAKTVSELKQFVAKLPQMQATKQSLALRMLCLFVVVDSWFLFWYNFLTVFNYFVQIHPSLN